MSLSSIADSIKLLATVSGILMIAYAGLMLVVIKDVQEKGKWKDMIFGVVIGLCIIYLAPLVGSILSGGHYCG